jgi:adenylate cyclase
VVLVTPVVEEAAKPQRRWWPITAAVVILLAFGGALWWQPWAPDVEPASIERMAYPLPDKPSIAVLPFDNLSGDPEQERLADGITEDIITDLSRYPDLFVIARNSVFTYKGKPVKVQQVAEDLGVRYVLEGSIQTSANQARVTAQLIDALDGYHVWAKRYERSLGDFFALQDDVTRAIAGELTGYGGRISGTVREIARRKPPESLTAYDYYLLGAEHKHRFTKEDNAKARELVHKAIELDPGFARAYLVLAWTHTMDLDNGWTPSATESVEKFRAAAEKAVTLDDEDAEAYSALALAHIYDGDVAGAMRAFERALQFGKNNADALALVGWSMIPIVEKEEAAHAVDYIQRAMRLNPVYPDWYLYALGAGQYHAHQFEQAIDTLRSARPVTNLVRMYLAASYAQLGRDDEAAQTAAELLQSNPQFSGRGQAEASGYLGEEARAHFLDGVHKAGLPE